ncbi:bifunctional glutamate N-acetyltransferase/amino-acid acetyltransferase ArgJ [Sphingomonas sp. LHG3406-1]|uniref:bifunctional glutamate N-acetyltransferase/amino-acid acetyltransferase ArgJ n=1 Tax=Sphingomonas sp. LHG3406-1 TaxID=2804617 RepID=UPI00260B289D|nr:bifunctional glutamate N-acetyltransferase/amino-acid acetyltransferase ArgJ [Sphingomonas sp. LHG3406-1]
MSVTAPRGFVAAGLHAGIKKSRPDMALLATEDRVAVTCAAVFTQNKFCAPPVQLDRALLEASGRKAAAVVVNSGNANAGTGAAGLADAQAMGAATAEALGIGPGDVLVCSTGIIGTPLPMDVILPAIPKLGAGLSVEGGAEAAKGILTTDTQAKEVVVRGDGWTIGGMAKGCGMIAPNMATMLAFLTTDADVPHEALQAMLKAASDATFNTLNVDGATSTNDMAMLFASGRKGAPSDLDGFGRALEDACRLLTLKMAHDAEGMTRLAHLHVTGAANDAEARIAARNIAENNLVKCSWYGADPYWGRLLAAAGSAGVALDVDKSFVSYGGIRVAQGGTNLAHDAQALTEHMLGTEFQIEVHLGAGSGEARVIGVDLGPGYIKENSVTS